MKLITSNIPKDLYRITPIAINFFIEEYFAPVAKKKIEEISIRFLGPSYQQASDTLAYCDYEDDEGRIPRVFDIVFNDKANRNIRFRHYITTIFHELTHANQHLTGRLKIVTRKNKNICIWEGKEYDEEKLTYWKHPWEIEAYGTEIVAYSHFADQYPELQLKRYKTKYNGRHLAQPMDERIDKLLARVKE